MEAVILVFCPSCGAATAPSDRYCGNCGTPTVLPPGFVPYAPMVPPPRDRTVTIVLLVVVLFVVGSVGVSALLYVMVSGLIQGPSNPPLFLGVTVSRSSDGTNWTITFTSVPMNMNPSVTDFGLTSASGIQAVPDTALTSLGGGMVPLSSGPGSVYLRYNGQTSGAVTAGDFITVGTTTSFGNSTAGYQGRITFAASIVWTGTLQ